MKLNQNIIFSIIVLSFVFFIAGCPTILPVTPKLKIIVQDIKNPHMEIGELVEIKWDYESSTTLVRQKYMLVQHTILGAIREEFELSNENRELSFIFQAPTTVFIMGYNSTTQDQPVTQVAIDIVFKTDYFLRASVKVRPTPQNTLLSALSRRYPRLGYPGNQSEKTISFTNFVGIRDVGESGILDFFKASEFGLDPVSPFRMISASREASNEYDSTEGSGFPKTCHEGMVPDDCNASVGLPAPFQIGGIDQANALVFGGALSYGGRPETVKTTTDEEVIVHYDPDTTGEPIFIVIALHSGVNNIFATPTGDLEIVDLYIGNVAQKLAINAFAGTNQKDASLGSRSADYSAIPPAAGALLSGDIKGAYIRDTIIMSGNEFNLNLTFDFTKIEWRVPFRNDDDLLGIPTARHLCEITNTCQNGG